MGRHKSKWALFRGQRFAVHRVCHDYVGVQNPGIQFRQGENRAIAILRFGDDVSGLSSSVFSLARLRPSSAVPRAGLPRRFPARQIQFGLKLVWKISEIFVLWEQRPALGFWQRQADFLR